MKLKVFKIYKKISKFTLFFLLIVFYTKPVFAYLDPGTGNIILQAIVGAIAAGATFISVYWQKLKNFFRKNKKEKNKE